MSSTGSHRPSPEKVAATLRQFCAWLGHHGELSWDHQSYYSGPYGKFAKRLYYTRKLPGTLAVAPMVFSEAFVPSARRLFHKPIRLPIADAHFAMGFAYLHQATGEASHFDRAQHFLDVLVATRCSGYQDYCWGYPFDWVTRTGTYPRETPLITTTPYVFEAFLQMHRLRERPEWRQIIDSIIRHACTDIKDYKYSEQADTCSYTPHDQGKIVNASAYRAAMLVMAGETRDYSRDQLLKIAGRNVNFVLETQKPDGSWPYAVDGVRDFVDHFHTCFVMKALAKIYHITDDRRILDALGRGVQYYLKHLFGADGMPQPFSKAPRLTVYKCELYDCAEAINLCLLLRKEFPQLDAALTTVVNGILDRWVKSDGSFRSRRLMFGWDNVPMHRWAQSQMFRSLAFYLCETGRTPGN